MSARAASMANLHAPAGGASDNHAHMEARHKALVAGHVGGSGGLGSSEDLSEEAEEEEQARVGAAASPPVALGGSSPFAAASAQREGGAPQPGRAAAAPAPAAGGASKGILECAAESLRQYVYRCQSANNLDSLRAAVLMQPPEPSNACFEPGGRFHNPQAPPPQQAAPFAKAAAGAGPGAGGAARGGSNDSSRGSGAADACGAAQTSGYSGSGSDGRASRDSGSGSGASSELSAPTPMAVSQLPDAAPPAAAAAALPARALKGCMHLMKPSKA
ncbi:hypothetical protein MNEG_10696 [Monoraphidium neglectum]|uniref:Uncharacterized protein n=1 Tax=Monoraphidium neglectum TaxID=145388 RepID=A0A0D2MRT0_9CHLO|nr:hypothetical protein MNEG_10696 [Monoraphidium neglectum]KIY97265.1 hypothetical protein MNEG_10696 [Monoraphidium neglectum]|eukprot:XP_013896285.1 hypothetical protein MNEG_10696 [Monoraphidium neglectum]